MGGCCPWCSRCMVAMRLWRGTLPGGPTWVPHFPSSRLQEAPPRTLDFSRERPCESKRRGDADSGCSRCLAWHAPASFSRRPYQWRRTPRRARALVLNESSRARIATQHPSSSLLVHHHLSASSSISRPSRKGRRSRRRWCSRHLLCRFCVYLILLVSPMSPHGCALCT